MMERSSFTASEASVRESYLNCGFDSRNRMTCSMTRGLRRASSDSKKRVRNSWATVSVDISISVFFMFGFLDLKLSATRSPINPDPRKVFLGAF